LKQRLQELRQLLLQYCTKSVLELCIEKHGVNIDTLELNPVMRPGSHLFERFLDTLEQHADKFSGELAF
jgi:hypothetical protein